MHWVLSLAVAQDGPIASSWWSPKGIWGDWYGLATSGGWCGMAMLYVRTNLELLISEPWRNTNLDLDLTWSVYMESQFTLYCMIYMEDIYNIQYVRCSCTYPYKKSVKCHGETQIQTPTPPGLSTWKRISHCTVYMEYIYSSMYNAVVHTRTSSALNFRLHLYCRVERWFLNHGETQIRTPIRLISVNMESHFTLYCIHQAFKTAGPWNQFFQTAVG